MIVPKKTSNLDIPPFKKMWNFLVQTLENFIKSQRCHYNFNFCLYIKTHISHGINNLNVTQTDTIPTIVVPSGETWKYWLLRNFIWERILSVDFQVSRTDNGLSTTGDSIFHLYFFCFYSLKNLMHFAKLIIFYLIFYNDKYL